MLLEVGISLQPVDLALCNQLETCQRLPRQHLSCQPLSCGNAGAEALGGALMLLFFATIGAGAGSLSALWSNGWLTAFIAIQLGVHLAVIVLGGYVIADLPMQVWA